MCGPQAARARRETPTCHGSFRGDNYEGLAGLSRVNRNEWQNPFGNCRKDGVHQCRTIGLSQNRNVIQLQCHPGVARRKSPPPIKPPGIDAGYDA
jgi:hypothetical protein